MTNARHDRTPEWPEALIALIDALRNYLRSNDEIAEAFLREGEITREQFDKWQAERVAYVEMLQRLEVEKIDPTLEGLIKP